MQIIGHRWYPNKKYKWETDDGNGTKRRKIVWNINKHFKKSIASKLDITNLTSKAKSDLNGLSIKNENNKKIKKWKWGIWNPDNKTNISARIINISLCYILFGRQQCSLNWYSGLWWLEH